VPRDVYEPPPPRAAPRVSRRAFLGFARARPRTDYDTATRRLREQTVSEALLRALEPVEAVLADVAAVDGDVLDLPLTAWRDVDLQKLPSADGSFDGVRSSFAAALAPRPVRMARELVRVVRPGGVVAITAWVPKGLPGRLDELIDRPEGIRAPSDWGRRDVMTQRLEPLLDGLVLRTRTVQLRFPDADRLAAALQAPPALRPQFDRLLASCNNAFEGVEIDARYLLAIGRRPDQHGYTARSHAEDEVAFGREEALQEDRVRQAQGPARVLEPHPREEVAEAQALLRARS
jgi:SAM-dependent methyltransferase